MYERYKYNENYFEKIDTKDKAYFLGLMYSDGNVYSGLAKKPRYRLQITLMNEDKYILQKFLDCLGSNSKMYSDRDKYTKLILDNKKLYKDIIELGCVPNKSLILEFPNEEQVPESLIWHFIRGYFDGDGSSQITRDRYLNISFTSSEKFIENLKRVLTKYGIESTIFHKRYLDKKLSAGSIGIGKRDSQKILYNLMYKEADDLFLKRKMDKFDILKHPLDREVSKFCIICGDEFFALDLCKKHYRKNRYLIYGN